MTTTYTAPLSSPASINDNDGILASHQAVSADLTPENLQPYDGVLVACFSKHPLVHYLSCQQGERGPLLATGIFEAAVLTALSLLATPAVEGGKPKTYPRWGIITTGKFWENHLADGVKELLGAGRLDANAKFAGVESTGLDASDFHGDLDPSVIRRKLEEASRRLFQKGQVDCIIMGCAGMAGLEEIIRTVAVDTYGPETGNQTYIIDGVKAGIGMLEQMVKNKRMFQAQ